MKLSRYSASGTTHSSGTGARSVETCVVTPSSRLDGSAARTTHRAMRRAGSGACGSWRSEVGGRCAVSLPRFSRASRPDDRRTRTPARARCTPPRRRAKTHCCWWSVRRGSIRSGYPSRPSRLPALLRGVEEVRVARRRVAGGREPPLQQRRGRAEHEERHADRDRQQRRPAEDRVVLVVGQERHRRPAPASRSRRSAALNDDEDRGEQERGGRAPAGGRRACRCARCAYR